VPDCGRRGLLSDAEACSRTQRPASLQNVERSVGPQALGPGSNAEACFRTQRPASLQNVERSVGPQALGPGSNAEACFRTQRPASLQNVERSVGPQALGPKLDVGFFWTQGQGSLGKRDIEAKEQIIF
jgi:hypothetical protein